MLTVALLVRIAITLIFLAVLVRLSGRRGLSGVNAFDLIVAVLVGNVAGMTVLGQAPLAAGLLALSALVWLHILTGALLRRRSGATPDTLVQQGRVHLAAWQQHAMSTAAMGTLLREAGAERLGDVQQLRLEADGAVSVRYRDEAHPLTPRDLPETTPAQEEERWPRAA